MARHNARHVRIVTWRRVFVRPLSVFGPWVIGAIWGVTPAPRPDTGRIIARGRFRLRAWAQVARRLIPLRGCRIELGSWAWSWVVPRPAWPPCRSSLANTGTHQRG
jgi:hypothetical protein